MKSGRFGIFSACVLIVGALALMVFRRSAAGEAVYPVERLVRLFDRAVLSRVSGAFAGAAAGAENIRLRREVAGLSLLRGDLERLRVENARLRRALDYRGRQPEAWLPAGVLSAGGGASATHRSVRVDKGSLDGVKVGAVVVVPEGLVGRVSEVSPHTAVIALLADPSVKVSCLILEDGSEPVHGILSGGGPDGLQLRHLDHTERLRAQAKVVTSGLGGVFPPGLEVGTLLLVTNGVRGVEGEVLPCVDSSTLEDVFIRRDQ